ncbi:Zinc finger CCHC domain-containing protein 8 [Trichoplax sp. H2]|nr:Zinc finger CCHC domain-containing protein 8 [Trichoplax sp. H2]|eukprot:RDD47337.1 Zinc finger CCHC domain-containing protein 8 [Trichoplax sp. H2]
MSYEPYQFLRLKKYQTTQLSPIMKVQFFSDCITETKQKEIEGMLANYISSNLLKDGNDEDQIAKNDTREQENSDSDESDHSDCLQDTQELLFYKYYVSDTNSSTAICNSAYRSINKPAYSQSSFNVLDENNENITEKKPKIECFNCDGNHCLADCPLPVDLYRVSRKRKEYKESHGIDSRNSTTRYHRSVNESIREFTEMDPASVSDELREALGIEQNEIPPYLYRMRELGYPLDYVRIRGGSAELKLYHEDGQEMDSQPDYGPEECCFELEFPGLNVPLPLNPLSRLEKSNSTPEMILLYQPSVPVNLEFMRQSNVNLTCNESNDSSSEKSADEIINEDSCCDENGKKKYEEREKLLENTENASIITATDVEMKESSILNQDNIPNDTDNVDELTEETESTERSSINNSNSWEAFPGAGEVAEPTGRYENLKVILQRKRKRKM